MAELMQKEEEKDQILQMEARKYFNNLSGIQYMINLKKLLDELPGNFQNNKKETCVLCIIKNDGNYIVSYVTDHNGVEYSYLKRDLLEALVCMGIKKGIIKL